MHPPKRGSGGLTKVMDEASADILRDLLTVEHRRLVNDHYNDDENASCEACARLARVATLLRRLS